MRGIIMGMKFKDVLKRIDGETPKKSSEIYVNVVNENGVKTSQTLISIDEIDGKFVFIAGIVFISNIEKEAMSFDELKIALHELEDEFSELECFLKAENSNVLVPLNRPYVSGRDDALVLEADFREFDKNDPQVVEEVFFNSCYGNRTDAIKDLTHILKELKLELACSTRDIKYDKISKTRSRLRVKVRGTATKIYDLRNGSFFHPDKDTYIKFGYKW